MKKWFMKILVLSVLFHLSSSQRRHAGEDDNSHNFPNNDFIKFLKDLQSSLGLGEKTLSNFGKYITKLVRDGQSYTARHFDKDYKKVKENPTFWNVIEFVKKTTWPGVVHGCVRIINFFSHIQQFLLQFLEKKCDKHIGKQNVFHPWVIMKQQDKTNISFLVFVYVTALSLILIKILSWSNFAVYLATGFLIYYVGGPYLVFKWLLTLTSLFWFIFDVIVHNPLQVALLIVVLYLLNLAKHYLSSDTRSTHVPTSHGERRRSSASRIPDQEERGAVLDGPDRDEFNSLADRIDSMERRTNLLNSKLDKLSRTIERVVPDDD